MGAGGCALDYDGDGNQDVYLVQSGALPGAGTDDPNASNRLFRNRGDGTFEDLTEGSGTGDRGYGQGAAAADYDNDGDTDLYVLNVGPNVLLRNDGDGTFTDVSREAGVANPLWGSSAAFLDADGDGDLDLYVVNYVAFTVATHVECGDPSKGRVSYCHPDVYLMAPDVFYRNRGDGTFADETTAAGLRDTTGKGLGVVVADLDNDHDPDLYVANDSTPNFLYQNAGDGTFTEIGLFVGVSHNEDGKTEAGMGTDAGDVDGDGLLDLFVTNLSRETNALYLAGGEGDYRYGTFTAGLSSPSFLQVGFGTDLLDVDNDGDLDLIVANGHVIDDIELVDDALNWRQPSQVFLNDGAGHFSELPAGTAGDLSTPRVARGSITLDYDNDGRLDLLLTFNNDRARLFRNVGEHPGHWIGFHLQGTSANRDGLGARVTVETPDGTRLVERRAGSSYQTGSDPRLHVGLGGKAVASRVTVRWSAEKSQVFNDLAGGRYYRIVEGEEPREVPARPTREGP